MVVEKAIHDTLSYFDVFSYAVTEQELWRFLHLRKREVTLVRFRNALLKLSQKGFIEMFKGYYVLTGNRQLVNKRLRRKIISDNKLPTAYKTVWILSFIPTAWLIGISGSLASDNSELEDDIDLFIITAPRTVWVTRFLTTLVLDLFGLRRKPFADKFKDKICLNMFIGYNCLELSSRDRNIFTAHEICHLKPLLNRHCAYEQLLEKNQWVRTLLPHALKQLPLPSHVPSMGLFILFQIIEPWVMRVQLWYMRRRRSNEVVREHIIRFHPHDARTWVLKQYARRLRQNTAKFSSALDKKRNDQ